MNEILVFEKYARDYDFWFEKNKYIYESEILAIKKVIQNKINSLEIGVGTGRFAVPLNIEIGIEPSDSMIKIAKNRGIKIIKGIGEYLPFKNETFDIILMVTTICFLKNPFKAITEIHRILKKDGIFINGMVDRDSFLGRYYIEKKKNSKFYRYAKIYSTKEVLNWLYNLNFCNINIYQTIFKMLNEIKEIEPVKKGYGKGGFVVISAKKV